MPVTLASADFNGDGFPDLVASDSGTANFEVFLGTGSGGFAAAPAGLISTGGIVGGLAVADFDGDGKADVAVTIPSTNSVVIFFGDGAGGFSSHQTYASGGNFPTSIAAGDVNGDSKPDVVVGNANGNNIAVLLNNGSGGFAPASSSPIATMQNPRSLVLGDFNGDHKLDLAFISDDSNHSYSADITVLLGDGAGGFTKAAGSPFFPQGNCVIGDYAAADLNGDGKLDLASANLSCFYSLSVGLGDGSGVFSFSGLFGPTPLGSTPSRIGIGDFDGDGHFDLAILYESSNTAVILLGDGKGGFTECPGSPFPANDFPYGLVIADFNNDGRLDMAIANVHAGKITVLLGTAMASTVTVLNSVPATVVQPFNLTAQVSASAALDAPGGSVSFRDGNAALGTASLTNGSATFNVSGLSLGSHEFYADYAGDLRTSPSTSARMPTTIVSSVPVWTVTKTHNGSFSQGQNGAAYTIMVSNLPNAGPPAGTVTVTEAVPNGLTLVQMSGTGWSCSSNTCSRSDAVAGGSSYPQITATFNVAATATANVTNSVSVSGGGAAQTANASDPTTITPVTQQVTLIANPARVTVSAGIGQVAPPQINFGVTSKPNSGAGFSVSSDQSWLGVNAQTGTTPATLGISANPSGLGAGTYNGNVLINYQGQVSAAVHVTFTVVPPSGGLLNATGSPVRVGTSPSAMVTGDFNGDGILDIAVLNSGTNNITILFGNNSGTYSVGPTSAPLTSPQAIVAGDFNGDGKLDIAVAQQSGYMAVLFGDGQGNLTLSGAGAGLGTAGSNPRGLATGDFNADGNLDIAVADMSSKGIIILLGDGKGNFAPAPTSPIPAPGTFDANEPWQVVTADMNGDGIPDLVVAYEQSPIVAVFLGDGKGGFTEAGGAPVVVTGMGMPSIETLAAGDFNQDGKLDVALVSGYTNMLAILTGDGAGGLLQPGSPISLGAAPQQPSPALFHAIAAVDLNGDGKLDLAIADPFANVLYVYLGDGAGGFTKAPGSPVTTVQAPAALAAGDFNNDRLQDLAIANSNDNSVSILLGGLAATTTGFSPTPPSSLSAGQPLTLTALVQAARNFTVPSGNVQFFDVGQSLGTVGVSNGSASFTVLNVTAGQHTYSANYTGDLRNAASTGSGSTVTGTAGAALSITKSHQGLIVQDRPAGYSIVVSNAANSSPTTGTVTVTENAPAGLTVNSMSGSGWSCTVPTCTRSDALNGSASYPPISVGVYVQPNAPAQLTNSATVSGGGSAGATANDPATITPNPPVLTITKSHSGNFGAGQIGVTYSLQVFDGPYAGPTSGAVTVTDSAPTGLTITGMSGTGWTCTIPSCTRSDSIGGSNSSFSGYPAITVTANVAANAPATLTNSATVSGGGSVSMTANDPTTITRNPPSLTISKTHSGNFGPPPAQGTYSLLVSNGGAYGPTFGAVSVTDNPPSGMTISSMSGDGWSCTIPTCTRTDSLNGGASYPLIFVSVAIAANAPAQLTNAATVSGGGNSGSFTASDPTTIIQNPPVLTVTKSHTGNFTQGQAGATYTVVVSNSGLGATSGSLVTLSDTLPAGLAATAISGSGWNCDLTTATCNRSDVLAPGQSYPAVTVTVNVSRTTANSVTNSASVSGGGAVHSASASDPTTVLPVAASTLLANPQFLEFAAGAGQAAPKAINIGVTSKLASGVTYAANTNQSWLHAATGSGATPDQASISVGTGGLPAGTYQGAVQFSASSQGYASSTTQVLLKVVNPSGALLPCQDGQGCGFTGAATASLGANVALSDFNGDGKLDQLQAFFNGGALTVTVALGNGSGGFGPANPIYQDPYGVSRVSTGPIAVATGDFNEDGNLDFAVFAPPASAGSLDVGTVFLGNGQGSFSQAPGSSFRSSVMFPNAVAVGDLNGDGIPDLVVASQDPAQVRVVQAFLGQGDGTFVPASGNFITVPNPGIYPAGGTATNSVVLADFNGDGKLDLAFSVSGANQVYVALGDGTGHFAAGSTVPTGVNPRVIAAADINGDGNKDLVVVDSGSNDITVLLGDGNGGLTPAPEGPIAIPAGASWLVVNDFNLDGRAGVAVGSSSTMFSVYTGGLAPTTATLTPSVNPATAGQPVTLTAQVSATQNLALPAGPVNFYKGAGAPGDLLGTANLVNGVASISYSFVSSGSYTVFAMYAGDTRTNQSTSPGVNLSVVGTPQLQVTKSHQGNFTQGQQNATYTITVINAAGAAPIPPPGAFVQENIPAGLTLVSMSGPGWSCAGATCQRQASDGLNGGGMYPSITVTVNVAPDAPASVTNSVTVSGGNTSASANDPTRIIANPAVLSIVKTHQGNFNQSQTGAAYTLTVSNGAGAGPTSGVVTITENPPAALTLTGMSGNGWSCTLPTCTRSDALSAGASYPPVTVTVNVVPGAPAQVTNSATVSGGGSATAGANDVTNINQNSPALGVNKTHVGNFSQGQVGATYTLRVNNGSNASPGPTSGTVTVTDNAPAGLTITAMSGTGWTCSIPSCTRSDVLTGGNLYPPITVTVNVASNAPAQLTNTATVSGGGSATMTNGDPTTIGADPPVLGLVKSHQGNFGQGQTGAAYSIVVSNGSSAGPTSGVVTVTENPPAGLTITGMSGSGWACTAPTCTRSDVLNGSASYPPITVTVNVAANAPAQLTNTATVSGGGSATVTSGDPTTIATNAAALSLSKSHNGFFTQGQSGATYSLVVSNAPSAGPTTGTVSVQENMPTGLTLTGMSGSGWSCNLPVCTRFDVLNGGASYPPILVTVTVAGNAPALVTNSATAFGGGSANSTATDPTPILSGQLGLPVLTIQKSHTGSFAQGQTGASYSVVVSNAGNAPANGTVSVTDTLPAGLTLVSMTGSGWSCNSTTCTRADGLSPNSAYPPITVTVNVDPSAPAKVTNMAAVSGGGAATASAGDDTAITATSNLPFGVIDSPGAQSTGTVSGAIAVTGWTLSHAGIATIGVWREPVANETPSPNGLVFIGNAALVPGARPDIAAAYPGYPGNDTGWGVLVLTNMLPGTGGLATGNGTYALHVIATAKDSTMADLGTRTITVDNAHAAQPFGTIDTPQNGEVVSGTGYVNFGWALTPNPANIIPKDGSTIWVFIDNKAVGHPAYNNYRPDIATLFPGLQNSNGAVGYYTIDTTKLTNGLHTIAWVATDNAGNAQGLGSRFFSVQN